MHDVPKNSKVYLVNKEGEYTEYASYDEFIKKRFSTYLNRQHRWSNKWFKTKENIDGLCYNIGNNWNDTYACYGHDYLLYSKATREVHNVDFLLFDSSWRVINSTKIKKDLANYISVNNINQKYIKGRRGWPRYEKHEWLGFRNGPVPRTSCSYSRFKYYRHPKTTQEKRYYFAHKFFIRSKRNFNNLPDVWDDDLRSRATSKSWKDCTKKRKQWM